MFDSAVVTSIVILRDDYRAIAIHGLDISHVSPGAFSVRVAGGSPLRDGSDLRLMISNVAQAQRRRRVYRPVGSVAPFSSGH